MAPGIAWMSKPAGFLKVIALVFDGLALGFLTHGVGFLKFAEYRMFFIVAGGYVLLLTFCLIGFLFGGFGASPGQEAIADIVGAVILIFLSSMMLLRVGDIGVTMHGDRNLIIYSSVLSLITGLLLGVDAIFVLKGDPTRSASEEEGMQDRRSGRTLAAVSDTPKKKQSKKDKKSQKKKKKETPDDIASITSDTVIIAPAGSSKSKGKKGDKSKTGEKEVKPIDSPSADRVARGQSVDEMPPSQASRKRSSGSRHGAPSHRRSAAEVEPDRTSSRDRARHGPPEKSRSVAEKSPRTLQEADETSSKPTHRKFKKGASDESPPKSRASEPTPRSASSRTPPSRFRPPPGTPSPESEFGEDDSD